MAEQRYCPKCKKTMSDVNFYQYRDGSKCELCKSCITMHINNYDEESYKWLLQKFDIPYVPNEWKKVREREFEKAYLKVQNSGAKDPRTAAYNMTKGTSVVFGKYLSKMKIKPWTQYKWEDSEMLQERAAAEARKYGQPEDEMKQKMEEMKAAYERGEISEAQYLTYNSLSEQVEQAMSAEDVFLAEESPEMKQVMGESPYPVNDNPFEKVDIPDVGNDLTQEDKIYLAMKWGRLYSASDWVLLEQMYKSYEESFDLHNADLINGTKQLCKLDLKGNLALDSGDFDSYSKIARASDSLRKSLKFTEAQRKEDKTSEFSCYGQIVAFAEKNNDEDYIRPIDLSIDRDIVDADIRDIKNFTKTLIEEDPAVFKMIEQYIKKRENLQSQEEIDATEDFELSDEDFKDFADTIEEQRKQDNLLDDEEEDEE